MIIMVVKGDFKKIQNRCIIIYFESSLFYNTRTVFTNYKKSFID